MKIAIVVQGRFHAFDLAKPLLRQGHEVKIFTNYPKWVARKFGMDGRVIESFWLHAPVSRFLEKIRAGRPWQATIAFDHVMFGKWAAGQVAKDRWDVIHAFSGVAEETLKAKLPGNPVRQVVRSSSHIRTQDEILQAEESRTGFAIERPAPWMIAREEREYAAADQIIGCSTFVARSFLERGFAAEKVKTLLLGVETKQFRATDDEIEARKKRVRSGEPLRVLMVGTLSPRKGALDLARIVEELPAGQFSFRFVGDVPAAGAQIVGRLGSRLELIPRQPQNELRNWYSQSDLFVFPTLEDGFAVVIAQANANGLPVLTTTNSSGPDLLREGETGWVLPIRRPECFVERLRQCHQSREEVAGMVERIHASHEPRDWDEVARDLAALSVN